MTKGTTSVCADSETPYTHAEHLLDKITADVHALAQGTGLTTSFHQETGDPADIIVKFAARQEADLIIIRLQRPGRTRLTASRQCVQ